MSDFCTETFWQNKQTVRFDKKKHLWIIEPNCSSWWEIDYMPKPFVCCNFDNYSLCTHCQFNNIISTEQRKRGILFFSKKFDVIYESYLSTLNSSLGWGYNNTTFQRHKQAKHIGVKIIRKEFFNILYQKWIKIFQIIAHASSYRLEHNIFEYNRHLKWL